MSCGLISAVGFQNPENMKPPDKLAKRPDFPIPMREFAMEERPRVPEAHSKRRVAHRDGNVGIVRKTTARCLALRRRTHGQGIPCPVNASGVQASSI